MPNIQTVAEHHAVLLKMIDPTNEMDSAQLEFARRCFYAGAFAIHCTYVHEIPKLPEGKATVEITKLDRELTAFLQILMEGNTP